MTRLLTQVTATLMAVPGGVENALHLDFTCHLIGDKGMVALSRVVARCSGLVSLTLVGNGIRDEAALTVRFRPLALYTGAFPYNP